MGQEKRQCVQPCLGLDMKAIIQKPKESACSGCFFNMGNNVCGLRDSFEDNFVSCYPNNCIYVIADVEPVNKESE